MLTTEIVSYKNAFQCKRNKNERVTVKAPVTHMLGDLIFDLTVHFSKLASLRIILLHRSCENRESYRNCIQEIICHFWRVLTVFCNSVGQNGQKVATEKFILQSRRKKTVQTLISRYKHSLPVPVRFEFIHRIISSLLSPMC